MDRNNILSKFWILAVVLSGCQKLEESLSLLKDPSPASSPGLQSSPSPSPNSTPRPTATPTPSPSPTPTPRPTATPVPTPSPTTSPPVSNNYDVELIVIWGESNAAGCANTLNTASINERGPRLKVKMLNNDPYGIDYPAFTFQTLDIDNNDNIKNGRLAGNNNIDNYAGVNSENHSFEIGLANQVDAGKFQKPVYLVKAAKSGGYISDYLNGPWKDKLQQRMDAAVAELKKSGKTYRITVWGSIGLNDYATGGPMGTGVIGGTVYVSRMQSFFSWFRGRYGSDTRFILTKFFDYGTYVHPYNVHIQTLDDADPGVYSIITKGATFMDEDVHWDYAGLKLIAERFVQTMQSFQR